MSTIGVARGGAKGPCPQKFLENIVILCFERRFSKQNNIILLKLNILLPPKFFGWLRHWCQPCLWKDILFQQIIRHFKILQSIYFAYDVGVISSYSNRIYMSTKRTWTGNNEKNWGENRGPNKNLGGGMAHQAPPLRIATECEFHTGKKLSLQESNQTIEIWDADFSFFRKYLVLNPNFPASSTAGTSTASPRTGEYESFISGERTNSMDQQHGHCKEAE